MGLNLNPIIIKESIGLKDLRRKSLAVDSNNIIHQFTSTIRTSKGEPLTDEKGNITSHLIGLLYRSTNLMGELGIPLLFVFEGGSPVLKRDTLRKRREERREAREEWEEAVERGDFEAARSKAMQATGLTTQMLGDAKTLLRYLGIPLIQAPGEAEAQAGYMNQKGDVWGCNSRDFDSLLYGTKNLVRYLTISTEKRPELIKLESFLHHLGITRRQLVDMAILMGTDYNEGVYRVGPKTSLKWIKRYGSIEELPEEKREKVTSYYEEIRDIFLNPNVKDDYSTDFYGLQEEELYRFLCEERDFPRDRVETAVDRMREFYQEY
jgi:flap endonuclease-1